MGAALIIIKLNVFHGAAAQANDVAPVVHDDAFADAPQAQADIWAAQRAPSPRAGTGSSGVADGPQRETPPAAPHEGPKPVIPPSVANLRDEVAADPHGPPPSLLAFAVEAHQRLEIGMQSEAAARELMQEMGEALSEPEALPTVVQATYLDHARHLAQRYPDLSDAAKALWHSASLEVLRLVD